jgi:hypothetical protein
MNNLRKLFRILETTAMLVALILSFASCNDLIGGKNEPGGNTPNQPSDTTTYKPVVYTSYDGDGTKYELTITRPSKAAVSFTPDIGDSYILVITKAGATKTNTGQITAVSGTTFTLKHTGTGETLSVIVSSASSNDGTIVSITGDIHIDNSTETITISGTLTTGTTTTVTAIAITSPPTKTQYNLGEELDTTGMVVTAAYGDRSTAVVTGYTTSGYVKTTLGNQTVTVTYSGKTATFTVNVIDNSKQTVATPTASPAAGSYNTAQSVTLSCATANATIYYTTNGNTPTEASTVYSGAISIGVSTTLKAIAVKDGMNDSDILTAVYTVQPAPATKIDFEGIWVGVDNNYTWVFSGSNHTLYKNWIYDYKGTFSVNADQTIFTENDTHIWRDRNWDSFGCITGFYLTILSDNRFMITDFRGSETYEKIRTSNDDLYIITGSGTSFTVTNGGTTIVRGAIQDVINAIRCLATGKNPTIQFGNGDVLDIGTERATFKNHGGDPWGQVTLTGKIASAATYYPSYGIINIWDSVSVTSAADIKNTDTGDGICNRSTGTLSITGGTVSTTSGIAVCADIAVINNRSEPSSSGTVNITGGTVSAPACAVFNYNTGKITVSGTAKVTSAGTYIGSGTIYLDNNGTDTATRLEITGGTVENTSTGTGNAIRNDSSGAVSITGGTVSKAGNSGYVVYKGGTGAINIGPGATIEGNTYGF